MSNVRRMSLKSRVFSIAASCFIACLAGVTSPAALAENGGVHHGSMCQGPGVTLSVAGIWNNTTVTRQVFCPTVRDEVYSTHGLNHAYVYYRLQGGGTISCTLFSMNQLGQSVGSASRSGSGTSGTLTFGPITGVSSGNYMVLCNLPANSFITSYRIDEWS